MKAPNGRSPSARFLLGTKILVFLSCLIPLACLVRDGLADALGANPIETIIHRAGWWALAFLMIVLAVTPLRKLLGWPWLGRFRRMLGLYAFFYGTLHFLAYLVLNQFFAWREIFKDIAEHPCITVGFAAYLMMIPLAATSTDGMIRRLGGSAWRRLHKLVYIIAISGVAHFWWLVKKDISEPAAFALILGVLLLVRVGYAINARQIPRISWPHRESSRPKFPVDRPMPSKAAGERRR